MIKNLYEDDLGYMVGTFYSDILGYDIEVRYDKEISQKYVEKNIHYFNNLEQDFLISICDALKRYYENYEKLYPDLCENLPTDILNDFEENPTSILRYVKIGVYRFHKCSK